MSKKKTFEEKVRSMTFKQIVGAMIKGIEHPKTDKIDMGSYGDYYKTGALYYCNGITTARKPFCVGCAATNTVLSLGDVEMNNKAKRAVDSIAETAQIVGSNYRFVSVFEHAINALRCGMRGEYNAHAKAGGFSLWPIENRARLPHLGTFDYKELLPKYKAWHKTL